MIDNVSTFAGGILGGLGTVKAVGGAAPKALPRNTTPSPALKNSPYHPETVASRSGPRSPSFAQQMAREVAELGVIAEEAERRAATTQLVTLATEVAANSSLRAGRTLAATEGLFKAAYPAQNAHIHKADTKGWLSLDLVPGNRAVFGAIRLLLKIDKDGVTFKPHNPHPRGN
jgi:hypothetical protein